MSEHRIDTGSDRVVVVEHAPEVVYVERERPAQETHETTIIRDNERSGLSPSMLLILVLAFLLIAGLIYTIATSGDDKSDAAGMNLSIDVAAPQLPSIDDVKTPDVKLPDLKVQRSDPPAATTDTAIAPGEPLEPVEQAETQ